MLVNPDSLQVMPLVSNDPIDRSLHPLVISMHRDRVVCENIVQLQIDLATRELNPPNDGSLYTVVRTIEFAIGARTRAMCRNVVQPRVLTRVVCTKRAAE